MGTSVLVDSEGAAVVTVKTRKVLGDGAVDMFGRPIPPRVECRVFHYENYGVLVVGTYEVQVARRALRKVGYDDTVVSLAYRPTLAGAQAARWPFGLWVGGTPAVAFYFEVGGF